MISRRAFVRLLAIFGLSLASAKTIHYLLTDWTPSSKENLVFISDQAKGVLSILIPIFLEGALPIDQAAKTIAIQKIIEIIDTNIFLEMHSSQITAINLFKSLTSSEQLQKIRGQSIDKVKFVKAQNFVENWANNPDTKILAGYFFLRSHIFTAWYGLDEARVNILSS